MPLRARADEVAVAGEDAERPVGAALALEQAAEDGQCSVVTPVRDGRPILARDHEIGAFALTDLLIDHRPDEGGVVGVGRLKSTAVGELDGLVRQRVQEVGQSDLSTHLGCDDTQRGPILVRDEATLADLRKRDQHKRFPARLASGRQRNVRQRLEVGPRTGEQRHAVGTTGPNERERLVGEEVIEHGTSRVGPDAGRLSSGVGASGRSWRRWSGAGSRG